MITAPLLPDESARLRRLHDLRILDTAAETEFDDITSLASELCGTPMALVSFVDEARQWFKSRVGVDLTETTRDISFCTHALASQELLVVPDAADDQRFTDNPLVTGDPFVRFYAGAPLQTSDGHVLGTLCVLDRRPRQLDEAQRRVLRVLGRHVVALLETRLQSRQLEAERTRLTDAQAVAHVGSWETDLATFAVRWSAECHRTFGTDPDTFAPSHPAFLERVHPDDRAAVDAAFLASIAGDGPDTIVHRIVRPDGAVRVVEERWRIARTPDGRPARALGTCQDVTERTHAHAALAASEARFKAVFANAATGIATVSPDGLLLDANDRFFEILKRERGAAAGMPVFDLAHPDDLPLFRTHVREVLARRRDSFVLELRFPHPDGQVTWGRVSVSAVFEHGETPTMLIGVVDDITRERLADERAAASAALVRTAGRMARIGGWTIEAASRALAWSDEAADLHDVPPGRTPRLDEALAMYDNDDRVVIDRALDACLADGTPFDLEAELVTAAGHRRRIRASGEPVRNASGRIVRIQGAIQDVTERHRAETSLREQAALLDNAQDAIIVRTVDGLIRYWNRGAERLYGWRADEAIGRLVQELIYPEPQGFTKAVARTVAAGDWVGELEQVARDGRRITVEAHWSLVRATPRGGPATILAINTDITARKRLEEQFLRAQRLESIGTLAGGIAHDLNNTLAPIILSTELLMHGGREPGERQLLDSILASARRGADMVRQVLSFARGVQGRRVEVDVAALVRDVAHMADETFFKAIEVRVDLPEGLRTLPGDPTQLHQVLVNLAVNARDAMPEGGVLTLAARNVDLDEEQARLEAAPAAGEYVRLEVRDTGTGMTPDVLAQAFDPFFTTKEPGKGTGLGLSTSLGIVQSHGGFIRVASEPGLGTAFRLFLPVAGRSDLDPASAVGAPLPRGRGEWILVIDDEALIRTVVRQTLEGAGYNVILAANGHEAVNTFANALDRVSAVITDLMMPGLDGTATVAALRRIRPGVPVIAASGLDAVDRVADAHAQGIRHFLPKPFTSELLLVTLRALLDAAPHRPEA